jgi:hypothetical protein
MDRHAITHVTLSTALALCLPAGAAAQPVLPVTLTVRVFNNAGVPAPDLERALTVAEAALASGGIAVSWRRCSDQQVLPASCDRQLEEGEVIVRLMTSGKAATTRVAMGDAKIDPARHCSRLASVYWDQVRFVARSALVDPRPLLGRAIAHEIGHLLINTNGHSDAGLMRATWSHAELRLNAPSQWQFAEREARVMRAALSAAR